MSISQHIPGNIKRVSKSIGYAAWLDTSDAWLGLPAVLSARLEPHQRAGLAYAALKSLSPEHAEMTAAAAIGAAGGQLPTFLNGMDEARFWAANATGTERKAYALASFEAMNPGDQVAFLGHIHGDTVRVAA
jgi:hypothetical protein